MRQLIVADILPDHTVHDNCYMSNPNPHERQRPEKRPLHFNNNTQPQRKRRKLHNTTSSSPPQAFWENLSKVWLTKRVLTELNKSYNQSASSPPHPRHQRARRPVTRNFAKSQSPPSTVADLLRHCEPGTLKNIKLFARCGGPDLSELRGVRSKRCIPTLVKTLMKIMPSTPNQYVRLISR